MIIVKRQKCHYSFIVDRIWSLYSEQTENGVRIMMNGQKLLLYCQQTENWSLYPVNRQKTSPLCEQAKNWSLYCAKRQKIYHSIAVSYTHLTLPTSSYV